MLVGESFHNIRPPLQVTLEALEKSPVEFYLTGSRYFGWATLVSDYDYFAEDNFLVQRVLYDLGFKRMTAAYYNDPQMTMVYRKEFIGSYSVATHIDVQLVRNVQLKRELQRILKLTDALRGLSKPQARKVWAAMYKVYEKGKYVK